MTFVRHIQRLHAYFRYEGFVLGMKYLYCFLIKPSNLSLFQCHMCEILPLLMKYHRLSNKYVK